jgi:predicted Zn finger-like uncharacterized protein
MNVSCPDCRSIFRVDPAKVPPSGVRARCSVCGGVISIPAPTGQSTPASGAPRTGSSGSESSAQARPRSTPQAQDGWDPAPFSNTAQRPSVGTSMQRPAASPPQPPSAPRGMDVQSASRPRPESVERTSAAATATPPSSASELPEFTPPPAVPPFTAPVSQPFAAPAAPPFIPGSARAATPPRAPSAPPFAPPAATDGGARRPLNPFLSKDPNQRAKRLARALVSDIITYHPAKHAEGLRDGTLKQLFREEIKKSFEEYIAQVGQQLAESTTYFQEALNEVLGAGKKIF